jgi:hypothetical protein
MPIQLRPISRRGFLKTSILGTAGAALASRSLADTRATDPHSWALFSDIHLAADPATVARNVNMTDHFKGVTKEVLALPAKPAGVFVTGDCAYNSGEKADYGQVTKLLEPLRADGLPVCLALGNHDNREHFWDVIQEGKVAKRAVADRQVSLIKTPRLNWFVLDSLEKTLMTPGNLGTPQLEWLAKTLDANADKPAVVLVHHNPGTVQNIGGLQDTDAFFAVIRPRKQVKAYFYGHTHIWNVSKDESGIHFVNLPAVAYVFKEGQPSGWVHATLQPKGMRLELSCLDKKHPANGQVVNLEWRA